MNDEIEQKIKQLYELSDVKDNPTCYIYDLRDITSKINSISSFAPDNVSLYYAMKANPNRDILKHVHKNKYVKGIEIASNGELVKALEFFDAEQIIFTGPGKTEKELREAIIRGIRLLNCESLVEAFRINKIASELNRKVNILLRINTNYYVDGADEHMAGQSTKMGIDEDKFLDAVKEIQKMQYIECRGVHVFSASGVLNYEYLIKYADYVFQLVSRLEKNEMKIDIIDFGGGIGIDYTKEGRKFDTEKYFSELRELILTYHFENKEMILELGKYIVGEAGYYTSKIIDIKKIKGYTHIVTAGGVNHMRLPIATDRKHPVYIIRCNEQAFGDFQEQVVNEIVDIEGPLCMDEDKISWDELVERADIGDIVVLTQSGAYGYSASTLWFLSHEFPGEYVISESGELIYE